MKRRYSTYGACVCFLLLAIRAADIAMFQGGEVIDALAWWLLTVSYGLLAASFLSKKTIFGTVGAALGAFSYVLIDAGYARIISKYAWRFDFALIIFCYAFLCAYFALLMMAALAKQNEPKYGIAAVFCVLGHFALMFVLAGFPPLINWVDALLWISGAILGSCAYSTMPKPGRVTAPEAQPACNTNSHMNGGKTMTQEEKKKFYEMLILFSGDCMHDRTRLLHKYPEADVDEAVTKGYLEKVGEDNFGVPIYSITESGKEVWE